MIQWWSRQFKWLYIIVIMHNVFSWAIWCFRNQSRFSMYQACILCSNADELSGFQICRSIKPQIACFRNGRSLFNGLVNKRLKSHACAASPKLLDRRSSLLMSQGIINIFHLRVMLHFGTEQFLQRCVVAFMLYLQKVYDKKRILQPLLILGSTGTIQLEALT